jgi:hypothetical protein
VAASPMAGSMDVRACVFLSSLSYLSFFSFTFITQGQQ